MADALGDALEIDLGLARSGHPIEQYGIEAIADRRGEAGGGGALVVVEVRLRMIGVGAGEGAVGVDGHCFEGPSLD